MNKLVFMWVALFLLFCFQSSISYAQIQIQGPRASAEAYSGVVYGPIDSSDTLWRIASRYKQDGRFTVYQTMLAIYQLNRQAFENSNFNNMVNGAILQLPSDSYIASIDPQRAKAKAESDERALSSNPTSIPSQPVAEPASPVIDDNLKDAPPLVNQEDLSKTQQQLQSQLNALNRQQTTQFEAVKEQVSSSIENVQSLIDENRKLYERLDKVNTDIDDLRNRVEGEMQVQINEQLALQRELLELVKNAQQEAEIKESESILNKLSTPTAMIIISSVATLLLLGGAAFFLLRKKPKTEQAPVIEKEESAIGNDIVDHDLVIGEAEDSSEADADELLRALSEENIDSGESDDILSDQLEEGLDEIQVDETVDEFDALEDEMLVPDSSDGQKVEEPKQSQSEEVNFDADAISLDDEGLDNQSINLSSNDSDEGTEVIEEPDDPVEAELIQSDTDIPPSTEQGEQDQSQANRLAIDPFKNDVPEGIQLNDEGEVDESTIEQIEQKIQEKDDEINKLTEEIMDQLDNAEELSSEATAEPAETTEPSEQTVATEIDVDAIMEEVAAEVPVETPEFSEPPATSDIDIDAIMEEAAADMPPPVQDPGNSADPAEIVEDDSELNLTDDDLEKILAENSMASDISLDDLKEIQDMTDEAASLEVPSAMDISENEPQASEQTDAPLETEQSKGIDDPDEIIADEELDSLLDEFTAEIESQADPVEVESEDLTLDKSNTDELQVSDIDELTDEILDGLDDDLEVREDLDALLDEISNESDSKLDDKALNDISDETQELPNNNQPEPTSESTDDLLADLPDLDEWLEGSDNNEESTTQPSAEQASLNAELEALDNTDFDEILAELESETEPSDDNKVEPVEQVKENPIDKAGLDLEALLSDADDDFTEVENLLAESETSTPLSDDEIELNLEKSLERLTESDASEKVIAQTEEASTENYQASNLDLAQIYIDMEDFESASDVLNEVIKKGSQDQIEEAQALLQEIATS